MTGTRFLELEEVLRLHEYSIEQHGGSHGVRDMGLLTSAIEMPRAGMGEHLFHSTIEAQAAAYWFHICSNHPFIDGNKRTAVYAMHVFLLENGYVLDLTNEQVYELTMALARGDVRKEELAEILRKAVRTQPVLEG